MKLYHGTSTRYLDAILSAGLLPRRGRTTSGNWKHTTLSRPDCIYLTNAYAIHFAWQACRPTTKTDHLAIIEIDTKKINPFRLMPDEDFLAQIFTEPSSSLADRCKHFRKRLDEFQMYWNESIIYLGTCCFQGVVTPDAITRYSIIEPGSLLHSLSDPTISLMNYKLCGAFYRGLIARAFGDEPEHQRWDIDRERLKYAEPGKVTVL